MIVREIKQRGTFVLLKRLLWLEEYSGLKEYKSKSTAKEQAQIITEILKRSDGICYNSKEDIIEILFNLCC